MDLAISSPPYMAPVASAPNTSTVEWPFETIRRMEYDCTPFALQSVTPNDSASFADPAGSEEITILSVDGSPASRSRSYSERVVPTVTKALRISDATNWVCGFLKS